jgi:hypothetical protein
MITCSFHVPCSTIPVADEALIQSAIASVNAADVRETTEEADCYRNVAQSALRLVELRKLCPQADDDEQMRQRIERTLAYQGMLQDRVADARAERLSRDVASMVGLCL